MSTMSSTNGSIIRQSGCFHACIRCACLHDMYPNGKCVESINSRMVVSILDVWRWRLANLAGSRAGSGVTGGWVRDGSGRRPQLAGTLEVGDSNPQPRLTLSHLSVCILVL